MGEALEAVGSEAIPLLIQALEGSSCRDPRTFSAVAEVFARIGRFSETAVPMLMQKILAGPTEQRCAAIRLLVGVGERASTAIQLLSKFADDAEEDATLRNTAAGALRM